MFSQPHCIVELLGAFIALTTTPEEALKGKDWKIWLSLEANVQKVKGKI